MKNKMCYRVISAFLAVMMVFTILPLNVFAMESDNTDTEQNASSSNASTNSNGEEITLSVEPTVNTLTYDKWDGITIATSLDGNGTVESPYTITNGAELMYFAAQVNGGNSYEGKHIHLKTNIDMDMFNNGKTWTPIGVLSSLPFKGIFDGECHEIINLNITYDSGKLADSEVYYIGFFGYIKNANIENFGVYNYKLNQTYNYNTEIGAMVAHAENSNITHCYANGNISATFEDSNPLNRDDVVTITSVLDVLDYANPNGQGVIVDLRNESSEINKSMVVGGDVSAVRIIGNEGTIYTNFNIVVEEHENFSLLIELINVTMRGNYSKGTIYSESERAIFIESLGTSNAIEGINGIHAINMPQGSLTVLGTSDLNVVGGNGSNAQVSGEDGVDGATAITCSKMQIDSNIKITASGGNGGNGADGDDGVETASGKDGSDGANGGNGGDGATAVIVDALFINNSSARVILIGGSGGNGGSGGSGGKGANASGDKWDASVRKGGNGGDGGNGGTAGCGGYGLLCNTSTPIVLNEDCEIIAGSSGKGGDGGNGANGGNGGNGWWAQNNGLGGSGGNAGSGGSTYASQTATNASVQGANLINGNTGTVGTAGTVGYMGSNGSKGWNTDSGTRVNGTAGSSGGIISIVTVEPIEDIIQQATIHPLLSSATLCVGGFCGYSDANSSINRCATVVNNIYVFDEISEWNEYNTTVSGNFVGNFEDVNVFNDIVAAYINDTNKLMRYETVDDAGNYHFDSWFGVAIANNNSALNVSVLNDFIDAQGLIFSNDFTATNTVTQKRSVVGKNELKSDILFPNFVFSGRFITEVTSISHSAFEGDSSLKTITFSTSITEIGYDAFRNSTVSNIVNVGDYVTTIGDRAFMKTDITDFVFGDNVVTIGENLFAGCSRLKTITIGKSLVEIPGLGSEFLFGLEKYSQTQKDTNSSEEDVTYSDNSGYYALQAYIVDSDNPVFASDEYGILYEKRIIPIAGENLAVLVAVIDAPKCADLKNFEFPKTSDNGGTSVGENEATDSHIVRIYDYAFAFNNSLTSVSLAGVRAIGDNAFLSCTSLKSVEFEQPSDLGEQYITILEEVYPTAVLDYNQSIGDKAFALCTSLENVNLDSPYITTIGYGAFADCGSGVKNVRLGCGINVIGDKAFTSLGSAAGATQIEWFDVIDSEHDCYSFDCVGNQLFTAKDGVLYKNLNNGTYELVMYPIIKRAAETTSYYYEETFSMPTDIVVSKISDYAFQYSVYLRYVSIDGYSNNGTVTKLDVGSYAFANSNVFEVSIGKNVRLLGANSESAYTVFDGCGYLYAINVDKQNSVYANFNDDGILYDKAISTLIKYPAGKDKVEYTLPQSVSVIASSAVKGNVNLERVVIDSYLKAIGQEAFFECKNLLGIYFRNVNAPEVYPESSPNVFYTGNIRTYIYYSKEAYTNYKNNWDALKARYSMDSNEDGFPDYNFAQFDVIFDTENYKDSEYYAIVVLDKNGKPLNGVYVELTDENGVVDSYVTVGGIRILTDDSINGGFALNYSANYKLRVIDNFGQYFPYENLNFRLDPLTKITYITLSVVPSVNGSNVSYDSFKFDDALDILGIDEDDIYNLTLDSVDINSELAKINKWLVTDVTISASCGFDATAKIIGYHLIQESEKLYSITDEELLKIINANAVAVAGGKKTVTIPISINTNILSSEKPIYFAVEFESEVNGEIRKDVVTTQLNIQVFEFSMASLDLGWISSGITLPVPSKLSQLLGMGNELKFGDYTDHPNLSNKKGKLEVTVGIEQDSFKVALSTGKSIWKKEEGFDEGNELKKVIEEWKKYQDDVFGKKYFEDTSEKKLSWAVSGFIEFKYKGVKDDGTPDYMMESGVTGTLKYTQEFGTTVQVWIIPIRLECELSASGTLKFSFVFDREAAQFCTPNLNFTIKGGIEVRAGVGFACASVGVYGSIEMIIVLDLYSPANDYETIEYSDFLKKWKMEADVGLYVKVDALFVKFKKTVSLLDLLGIEAELIIYENGVWWPKDKQEASVMMLNAALYDDSNYELVTSSSSDGVTAYLTYSGKIESAYDGIVPKLIQVGDIIYIVYQDDVNDDEQDMYDAYNYQKIVYQTYDIKSGYVSEPVILDNNGFSDGAFDIHYDGKNVVIVYTQLKERLDADDFAQINDENNTDMTMSSYLELFEVKTAILQQDEFITSDFITNDNCYDNNICVGEIGGNTVAVWVQNAENTMFGTSNDNNLSIMSSTLINGAWTSPTPVKTGLNTIVDISIGSEGVLYITDSNNNLSTIMLEDGTEESGYSDRILNVVELDSDVLVVTDEGTYLYPEYSNGTFNYCSNGNIYYLNLEDGTSTPILSETVDALCEDYTVLTDTDGSIKAFVYLDTTYYEQKAFIGENDNWWIGTIDTGIQATDSADAEIGENGNWFINNVDTGIASKLDGTNLYGVFRNDDKWGSPIQLTDFGERVYINKYSVIDQGEGMYLSVFISRIEGSISDNYESYNQFDTSWYDYPTAANMGEISLDVDSVVPEEDATITIEISNNGYQALESVYVEILVENDLIYSGNQTEFYDENGIEIDGALLSGQTAYVKVSFTPKAPSTELYTVSALGTSKDIQVWFSDFEVFAKQVLIGSDYYVIAYVSNNGYVPASYLLAAKDVNGNIYSATTKQLSYGEGQYFEIPLRKQECKIGENGNWIVGEIDTGIVSTSTDVVAIGSNGNWFINGVDTNCGAYSLDNEFIIIELDANNEYNVANNTTTVAVSTTTENETFNLDELVGLSTTTAKLDVRTPENIVVEFKSSYALSEIKINGLTLVRDVAYSLNNNVVTLYAEYLAEKFEFGEYVVNFIFSDQSATKEAHLVLNITKTFSVNWDVDGVITEQEYEYGMTPSNNIVPTKDSTIQYSYQFIGWDSNGDGEADHITDVISDVTYVAVFEAVLNEYTIYWLVDGLRYEMQVPYGIIPTYGSVPTKASDSQYDYVFAGWDKELVAVTENSTYTAIFDAVLRKYTISTIVDGNSSIMQVEYGTLPILPTPTKNSDAQYHYSFMGWSPEVSTVLGNQTYTAQFERTLRQYTVTWIVDGIETETTYDYGSLPVYNGTPSRENNKENSYSFVGWDKEITSVTGDITYIAQFDEIRNSYTISFIVDGKVYTEDFAYGSIPVFSGETTKPEDELYRYVFSGWDKEIAAVDGEATYTAQYEAILIGSATVSNSDFKTAWNCEFTTTISLSNVQNMTTTTLTIYYNPMLVELSTYLCYDEVKVVASDNGYITLQVAGLSDGEKNIVDLTFTTSNNAPFGNSHFIDVVCEDNITSKLGELTIYQMGDVNMDGKVNTVDAAMIQRYAVKKLELDDIQKVYANVNGDLNTDGSSKVNTIDAAMVQRYAVKKINELGNRITINFVDSEEIVSLTLVKGNELNYEPADGYEWSLAADQFVSVDFTTLTSDATVYMIKQ